MHSLAGNKTPRAQVDVTPDTLPGMADPHEFNPRIVTARDQARTAADIGFATIGRTMLPDDHKPLSPVQSEIGVVRQPALHPRTEPAQYGDTSGSNGRKKAVTISSTPALDAIEHIAAMQEHYFQSGPFHGRDRPPRHSAIAKFIADRHKAAQKPAPEESPNGRSALE